MNIAIMQPYFFPYIGYYQLVNSADEFIFFDDVNFIKKGYINRNKIANNGNSVDFSLPIRRISQFKKINEHFYIDDFENFKKMLFFSYKKSPYFKEIFSIIDNIISSKEMNVAILNSKTITAVFDYLNIEKKFSFSSLIPTPTEKKGQERIVFICQKKTSNAYHNPIGGKENNLYCPDFFKKNGIDLKFIKRIRGNHPISQNNFSMIDALMNNSPEKIKEHLNDYELIE